MIALLLTAAVALPQQEAWPTDTTLAVPARTRVHVGSLTGDVTITAWDRNQVRVQAAHSSRDEVRLRLEGSVLEIGSRRETGLGLGGPTDYRITVPAATAIEVTAMNGDLVITGVRADIKAGTVSGDITVEGGDGAIVLRTMDGNVTVSGVRGRLEVNTASGDVLVTDAEAELRIEAISGEVRLRGIRARRVDAQVVSGDVEYEGTIARDGSYLLASHTGDVIVAIPDGTDATIRVGLGSGELSASFQLPAVDRTSRRRATVRLGGGGASMELETFSGDVRLVRPSELRSPRD